MILDDSDDDDADFWNEQNSRFWNVKNVKTFYEQDCVRTNRYRQPN